MSSYTRCHNCGAEGHYARQCTAAGPDGPPLEGTPPDPRLRGPAYTQRVPLSPPPEEIGDAAAWAAAIRDAMGWDADSEERRLRRIAAEQVRESRESRYACLDSAPGFMGA